MALWHWSSAQGIRHRRAAADAPRPTAARHDSRPRLASDLVHHHHPPGLNRAPAKPHQTQRMVTQSLEGVASSIRCEPFRLRGLRHSMASRRYDSNCSFSRRAYISRSSCSFRSLSLRISRSRSSRSLTSASPCAYLILFRLLMALLT